MPPSIDITTGGSATFVAKSLAGPNGSTPPSPAAIQTTNYPVYMANLAIPQWVISPIKIDPKASSIVFDWLQKRVKDIYASASPDLKTVMDSVSSYTVAASAFGGATLGSVVTINPFFGGVSDRRLDTVTGGNCGTGTAKTFTRTFLHESRHAYQYKLYTTAGNNSDNDYLPKTVPVGPVDIVIDSTDERTVCNQEAQLTELRRFKGDNVFDAWEADPNNPTDATIGWSSRAWEMDAWVFAWTNAH